MYTQQLLEELFSLENVYNEVALLKSTIFYQKLKLNNGAIDWIEDLEKLFLAERLNGAKFNRHINAMLKDEPLIENNVALQERLVAAANHFVPKLDALLDNLKKHPLITEHKETADPINESFNTTAMAFFSASYFLSFCRKPFTLLGFLQHKLNQRIK